jgi:hypothetical protein
MKGINCDKCDERIHSNEQMIMYSSTRMDNNYYFHYDCFFQPIINRIIQGMKADRDLVVLALFQDKIK